MNKILEKIKNLFPCLNQIDFVQNPPSVVHMPAGTCAFQEGEHSTHIALLLSGTLRVVKTSESGRVIVLYRVTPGECCILLLSSVLAGIPYPATAYVEEEAEALLLPVQQFKDWVEQSDCLRVFVYSHLTQRLAALMTLVEELAFERMDHRLAEFILTKTSREQQLLKTTHEGIALELGTVREVISRLLKEFEKENWIKVTRGKITVLNRSGLQKALSFL
jgi:CRP/FNR family transcriptional regulator